MIFNNSKGQVAIEFLILITFVVFSITGLLMVLANQSESIKESYDRSRVAQIHNMVQSEINLALSSSPKYTRTFRLPSSIDNAIYNLQVIDDIELIIEYKGIERVYFLSGNASENTSINVNSIGKGYNNIVKYCSESMCNINISN